MKKSPGYEVKIERVPHRYAVERSRKIYWLLHRKAKDKSEEINVQEKAK